MFDPLQARPWNTFFLIVVLIWGQTGFAMVVLSSAIKAVPDEYIEAARVDGATESQIFWRIVLPQIRSTILVVVTTLIILVMKVFDIVKVMTNGEFGTNVVANEMFDQAFRFGNVGRGAALASVLFLAVLPLMYITSAASGRSHSCSAIQSEPGRRLDPEGDEPRDGGLTIDGEPRGQSIAEHHHRGRGVDGRRPRRLRVGHGLVPVRAVRRDRPADHRRSGRHGARRLVCGRRLRPVQADLVGPGAMLATYGVHILAISVFGLLSAAASGADLAPYLTSAALLAATIAMVVLLRTEQVDADFPSDKDSTTGRTVALWSIVGVWSLPHRTAALVVPRRAGGEDRRLVDDLHQPAADDRELPDHVLESGGSSAPEHVRGVPQLGRHRAPGHRDPHLHRPLRRHAFAWMDFPGRKWLFIVVVSLMAVPLQMSLIPLLQLYTGGAHIGDVTIFPDLDMNGKAVAVWITHTGFGLPLAIFLLFNYVSGLPKDIFEAARIDGADHYTIFWRLIVPLSVPALAAFGIFQFLWTWNDYLVALTFLGGNADAHPLTMRLANLSGGRGQDWHVLTAAAFVTMSVPLIVFFSLQRYFVRGLLAGSVKG